MKLAIFDIDGTLTKTNKIDNECFVKAFADSHKITNIETDWTKYNHVTDSGIALEIFNEKLGQMPNEQDFIKFKSYFIKGLRESSVKNKALFAEIKNAKVMLQKLKLEKDWAITLATGCFFDSAKLKLAMAKIDVKGFPMATADDAVSREEILQIAIEKSLKYFQQSDFDKIVSIGDGIWDVQTAKNLNLNFIGISNSKRAKQLRKEGAELIIKDFRNYELFIEYLNK